MDIKSINLRQSPEGKAVVTMVLGSPPNELSKICQDIQNGKRYTLAIKPYREPKTNDQVGAIWGKIGEIADALYASKDEIYEECLRRYGQSVAMRIPKEALGTIQGLFKLTDVKAEREDGTVFVKAYKGLSQMDSAEASRLLEGVLSECEQVGISKEIRSGY